MTHSLKQMIARVCAVLLLATSGSAAMANGGSGKGDGDGIFGYESSSDSRVIRAHCINQILNAKDDKLNSNTAIDLGWCLMNTRELYKNRDPYMRNNSTCMMLEFAAAEACSGVWGFLGRDHAGCKWNYSVRVGKMQGWVSNFGLCNSSCPHVNPPVISAYPWDMWPCGDKNPPGWIVQLVP